jgi:hypothetical protein
MFRDCEDLSNYVSFEGHVLIIGHAYRLAGPSCIYNVIGESSQRLANVDGDPCHTVGRVDITDLGNIRGGYADAIASRRGDRKGHALEVEQLQEDAKFLRGISRIHGTI